MLPQHNKIASYDLPMLVAYTLKHILSIFQYCAFMLHIYYKMFTAV
jgi:hypothetical protein